MRLNKDYFNQIEVPPYILTKANGDYIGKINCVDTQSLVLNLEIPELSCKTYRFIDGELNEIYPKLTEMKYIHVPQIGNFIITDVTEEDDGVNASKTISAKSEEYNLNQRQLEEFYINTGETYSIDEVVLFNEENPEKSLLHLVLKESPDWTIGYVNEELKDMTRRFEVSSTDVYSFLTNDVEEYFECIVTFDSLNHKINIYSEDEFGNDTGIFASFDNLLVNTSLSCSIDEIKTCITILGEDDIDLREVNLGIDKLYNLDYFATTEYMSEETVFSYNRWKENILNNQGVYKELSLKNKQLYKQINYLTNEKMPDNLDSENWDDYCLVLLQERLSSFEDQQAVMIKAGQSNSSHADYPKYLVLLHKINALKNIYIPKIEKEIDKLTQEQKGVSEDMQIACDICALKNNFTPKGYIEITKFIRSDNISTDKYVVTDTMTDEERLDMLSEMLDYGNRELLKVCQPQISFSSTIMNLFAMEEFNELTIDFTCGNYIYILLRDNYNVKARLTSISINFLNIDEFSVEFSNLHKTRTRTIFTDITNAISTATKAAKTVDRNINKLSEISKSVEKLDSVLSDGILSSGESISTENSDMVIDNRGITLGGNGQDKVFIGGTGIVISNDNLQTTKTILGEVEFTNKNGDKEKKFGIVTDLVNEGYIGNSIMENNTLKNSEVNSSTLKNNTIQNSEISVSELGQVNMVESTIGGSRFSYGIINNTGIYIGKYGEDGDSWNSYLYIYDNDGNIKGYLGADAQFLDLQNMLKIKWIPDESQIGYEPYTIYCIPK